MKSATTHKLQFSTQKGIHLIDPNYLVHCQAEGNYTQFFLYSGKKLLFCHQLGQVEQMLPSSHFLRVHHSHIINWNFVVQYCYDNGGCIILSNGDVVPVARRRKRRLKELLFNQT